MNTGNDLNSISSPDPMSDKLWFFITVSAAVMSFILTLYFISFYPVQTDEIGSLTRTSASWLHTFFNNDIRYNPPLHVLYLKYLLTLTDNLFVLKTMYCIFAPLSMVFISLIGKKYFSNTAGALACIIILSKPFFFQQFILMRGQAIMLCLFLAALYFFYDVYHNDSHFALYIVLSIIAFYSHYMMVVPLAIQFSILLMKKKREGLKPLLIGLAVLFVAMAPLIIPFVQGVLARNAEFPSNSEKSPLIIFFNYLYVLKSDIYPYATLPGFIFHFVMPAILFGFSIFEFFKRRNLLSKLFVFSFLLTALTFMVFKSRNSYFCFLAPMTIIAASAALSRLFFESKNLHRIKWAAVIAFIVLFGFFDFYKFTRVNKKTVVLEYYFDMAMEMPQLIKENDDIKVIAFEDQNMLWSVYSYILRNSYGAYNAHSFMNVMRIETRFMDSKDYFMVNIPETNKFLFYFGTSAAYDEFKAKYYGYYWMMYDTPTYKKASFLKDSTDRCTIFRKSRNLTLFRCFGI